MAKLLYIPEGRYIKWWSENHDRTDTEIYENSNFYKSDTGYGGMPIEDYLINFITSTWSLQGGTKKYNQLDEEHDYLLSEFEIIYD